jgi:hypothetical protein
MRNVVAILMGAGLVCCLGAGCATPPPPPKPLTYLSVDRSAGVIAQAPQKAVSKNFKRGGMYFGNYNFRPAPDVAAYAKVLSAAAGSPVVKNADVQLMVPFAFDILFFGYNQATDKATAQAN